MDDRPYIVWASCGEIPACWWVRCRGGGYRCWDLPKLFVRPHLLTIPVRDVHWFNGDREAIIEIQNAREGVK